MGSPAPIAGIYAIKNMVNNKLYIGSSNNIERRWENHLYNLRKGTHANKYLQSSYKKYGEKNFNFEIIDDLTNFTNRSDFINILIDAEDYYINAYKTLKNGYNLVLADRSCLSREMRDKIGNKISKVNNTYGIKYVTRERSRKTMLWRYRNPKKNLSFRKKEIKELYNEVLNNNDDWIILNKNKALESYRTDFFYKIDSFDFGVKNVKKRLNKKYKKGYVFIYDIKRKGQKRICIERSSLLKLIKELKKRNLLVIVDHVKLLKSIKEEENG